MTLPNLRRLRLREYSSDVSPIQERARTAFMSRSTYLETVVLNFPYLYGNPLMTFTFEGLTLRNLRSLTVAHTNGRATNAPDSRALADTFRAFIRRHPKLVALSLTAPFVTDEFVFSLNDLEHIHALQLPALALNIEPVPGPLQLQVLSIVLEWKWPYPADIPTRLRPVSLHLRCLHIGLPFLPVQKRDLVPFLRQIVTCLPVVEEIGVSVRSAASEELNAMALVRLSTFTECLLF